MFKLGYKQDVRRSVILEYCYSEYAETNGSDDPPPVARQSGGEGCQQPYPAHQYVGDDARYGQRFAVIGSPCVLMAWAIGDGDAAETATALNAASAAPTSMRTNADRTVLGGPHFLYMIGGAAARIVDGNDRGLAGSAYGVLGRIEAVDSDL